MRFETEPSATVDEFRLLLSNLKTTVSSSRRRVKCEECTESSLEMALRYNPPTQRDNWLWAKGAAQTMGHINFGRVVLGGLLAGLVINISEFLLNGVVLAEDMNAVMAAMNKPPMTGSMIGLFLLLGFGLGVVLVWLYAAIRPRLH